jgi:DNA-binding FadR family transcriptional regulator
MDSLPLASSQSDDDRKRLSRPTQVAEAIKDWIVAEDFGAGDRLPSETEMIERFSMSKGTIREAMRILDAQGLIKSRTGPGGGSFVHEVSRERARALLGNYFYFKDLTIADIYQLRRVLEPELVASLAGSLDEVALVELEAILGLYSDPATNEEEEREQHIASLKFHAALAKLSDNPLLSFLIDFMVNILADITVYRQLYTPINLDLWAKGRDYQARLIEALRAGDSRAARAVMKAHMQTAQAIMEGQERVSLTRFISE